MASSDQEGIEIGEDHIEMYEEVDVAPETENGDEQEKVTEGEHEVMEGDNHEHEEIDEMSSSRKRSRSPSETAPEEKDDFDDNELDSDVDESEEKDEGVEDPEVEEHELLSMPHLRHVMNDVGHLKQERRIMVRPVTFDELNHPAVLSAAAKDTCEEIVVHFVRPKDNPYDWKGFLTMQFTSGLVGDETTEELKLIREDLVVDCEKKSGYPWTTVDNWVREEKGNKRWTDCILYIKNVGENVTETELKEVFTEASDVVIPQSDKKRDEKKENTKTTRFAYAVYRTGELARMAAEEFTSKTVELDGQVLKVYQYRIPVDVMPRGLLKLHERRTVLKYLEKLTEKVESSTDDQKAPDWVTKRYKLCSEIIERDNKQRHTHHLSVPNLAGLREMRAVKILRGDERRELLIRLGVLDRPRRSYRHDNKSRSRERDRDSGRRKSYGSGRTSAKPQSLLGMPPPPSLLTLPQTAVPMSLMMQNNLAFMSGMIGRNMNMMSVGGASSSGGRSSSYRTSSSSAGRSVEPSSKLLRLDASGNFHVDYSKDRRHQSSASSSRDDKSSRTSKGGSSSYSRSDRK
jgi:RNA recognition motif-containing protein